MDKRNERFIERIAAINTLIDYRGAFGEELRSPKIQGALCEYHRKIEKEFAMRRGGGFNSYKILDFIETL